MKTICVLILSLLISFTCYTQPVFDWVRVYGGNIPSGTPNEFCYSVAVDTYGSSYSVGTFMSVGNFDPGISNTSYSSNGMVDAYLCKFDSSGNFEWAFTFGGVFNDNALGIAYDGDSSIYITGVFTGNADFDPDTSSQFILNGTHVQNIFLAKYSLDAKLIWAFVIQGNCLARSISTDQDGNVYITGSHRNNVDFDPGPGFAIAPSHYSLSSNMFLAKYHSAGGFVWLIHGGGIFDDSGQDIIINNNSLYWTGFCGGNDSLFHSGGITELYGNDKNEVFVIKANALTGNITGTAVMGGADNDTGRSIVIGNNKVYCTGRFHDTADFNPGTGQAMLNSAGESDGFIVVLDTSLTFINAFAFGHPDSDDSGMSVSINQYNEVILAGEFKGTVDLGFNSGSTILTGSLTSYSGFLAKFDSNLNNLWAFHFQGGASHITKTHAIENNIYVTGYSSGMVDFDPASSYSGQPPFSQTSFVAKYHDSASSSLYQINNDSVHSADFVSLNTDGDFLIAGVSINPGGVYEIQLIDIKGSLLYKKSQVFAAGLNYLKIPLQGKSHSLLLISISNSGGYVQSKIFKY